MTLSDILECGIVVNEALSENDLNRMYIDQNELWIGKDPHKKLNEKMVAECFNAVNLLKYHNGTFYSKNGIIDDEGLKHELWLSITDVDILTDTERIVDKLFGACRLSATVPSIAINPNIIPFANGNFYVDEWAFHVDEITTVPYRFNVTLSGKVPETPYFNKWLNDLFEKEDQITLQEYLGYCLVPTTKCQKALFLVGEGGAGKSGMGVILESLLGSADINVPNTKEFLDNKFMLSELEHKLVLYDDDLDNSALENTGLYKKLITNNVSITADKKHAKPYKFIPKIKLVACCNQMLTSAFDKTEGFYRRLLPLIIKPISEDFEPDHNFYDHLKEEAEGIAIWALFGLNRLIHNDWILYESQRTKTYMASKRDDENHLPLFLESSFTFDPDAPGYHTKKIVEAYREWCTRNAVTAVRDRALQKWLSDNAEKYGIVKDEHLVIGDERARGYKGLVLVDKVVKPKKIKLV